MKARNGAVICGEAVPAGGAFIDIDAVKPRKEGDYDPDPLPGDSENAGSGVNSGDGYQRGHGKTENGHDDNGGGIPGPEGDHFPVAVKKEIQHGQVNVEVILLINEGVGQKKNKGQAQEERHEDRLQPGGQPGESGCSPGQRQR